MPAGPAPLGLMYFAAVKLAGYTAAAVLLRRRYPESTAAPWMVGGVRTLIGLGAGFGAVFVATRLGILRSELGFYLLLAPLRMCEWLLLLRLFFNRPHWKWGQSLMTAGVGTVWSYALDLPALLAVFALPGGAWIC